MPRTPYVLARRAASLFCACLLASCSPKPVPDAVWALEEVRFVPRVAQVSQDAGNQALASVLGNVRGVRVARAEEFGGPTWRLAAVAQADPLRPNQLQLGLKLSQNGRMPPLKAFVPLAEGSPEALAEATLRAWNLVAGMRRLAEAGPAAWHRALGGAAAGTAAEAGAEVVWPKRPSLLADAADFEDWPEEAEQDPEGWLARLDAADSDGQRAALAQLRMVALERAVATRLCAAGPALLHLVGRAGGPRATPLDREVALRALGALVALGDEGAVLPLIDLGQRRAASFLLQIVYTVGALGGRAAEGYLVTLASGHDDPEVRAAASAAVAGLVARGNGQASACGAGARTG